MKNRIVLLLLALTLTAATAWATTPATAIKDPETKTPPAAAKAETKPESAAPDTDLSSTMDASTLEVIAGTVVGPEHFDRTLTIRDFIGAEVVGKEGQTVATVEDLAIEPDGTFTGAYLHVGPEIGLKGTLIHLPWAQLEVEQLNAAGVRLKLPVAATEIFAAVENYRDARPEPTAPASEEPTERLEIEAAADLVPAEGADSQARTDAPAEAWREFPARPESAAIVRMVAHNIRTALGEVAEVDPDHAMQHVQLRTVGAKLFLEGRVADAGLRDQIGAVAVASTDLRVINRLSVREHLSSLP